MQVTGRRRINPWIIDNRLFVLRYSKTKLIGLNFLKILHTIFFHRYFLSIRSIDVDILDLTLSVINDVDLGTLIDSRVSPLMRQPLSTGEKF